MIFMFTLQIQLSCWLAQACTQYIKSNFESWRAHLSYLHPLYTFSFTISVIEETSHVSRHKISHNQRCMQVPGLVDCVANLFSGLNVAVNICEIKCWWWTIGQSEVLPATKTIGHAQGDSCHLSHMIVSYATRNDFSHHHCNHCKLLILAWYLPNALARFVVVLSFAME